MTIKVKTIVSALLCASLMAMTQTYAQSQSRVTSRIEPSSSGTVQRINHVTATITIESIEYTYPRSLTVTGLAVKAVNIDHLLPGMEIEFSIRESRTQLDKPVIRSIHVPPK